jgi:hypothetical protein
MSWFQIERVDYSLVGWLEPGRDFLVFLSFPTLSQSLQLSDQARACPAFELKIVMIFD